uniref:Crossover junction endonuclease MUS81 n=1 Tax=Glossina palpalis gambiensis TaxID=67801 RepID=A0A1B0BFR5_9MUSC
MIMSRVQRLEIRLKRPNAIFETWLENWLREAERRNSKSRYKLREALNALKMYPLPLASGRECGILRGFGPALCKLIDNEMRREQHKAQAIVANNSMYQNEIQNVVESVKKNKRNQKDKQTKLTKKERKALEEKQWRSKEVIMQPGTFRIKLIVDTQETSGKHKRLLDQTRSYLECLKVDYEIRRLTVGDFLWIACDQEGNELVLPYIVERKRMDDLSSSIRDGRFHEQKHRLNQCDIPNVIYLIEDYGENEHLGLPIENLQQALINTLIHNRFSVAHTENHSRSIAYLQGLTQILIRIYKDKVLKSCANVDMARVSQSSEAEVSLHKFKSLNEDSARNAQLTVKELFILQLLQLHSLSLEKSLAITKIYPTPRFLLEAYKACKSLQDARQLLANIRFGQLQRPVGSKISQSLHDFYTNEF